MTDYFELLSKRLKKQAEVGLPVVYQYDDLPMEFRRQVVHIWRDAMPYEPSHSVGETSISETVWNAIFKTYTEEIGVFFLNDLKKDPLAQLTVYIQQADAVGVLDIIELSFNVICRVKQIDTYEQFRQGLDKYLPPDDAVRKLNRRFQEHKIGYEFIEGRLVRKDSQFAHAEVVEPAIRLLHDMKFQGASNEFMKAHEHYRHGRNSEAIVEALKAFESTLKTICTERGWVFSPGDTAARLIQIVIDEGLVDKSITNHLNALRTTMEGLATIRNKTSGHGAGPVPITIPDYLASYALHLAASNIVFLVEAHKALI